MSALLELTKRLAAVKKEIKAALAEKGVAVTDDDPLSAYPAKIAQIGGTPAFYAKNPVRLAPKAGERVLIQPRTGKAETKLRLYSSRQFAGNVNDDFLTSLVMLPAAGIVFDAYKTLFSYDEEAGFAALRASPDYSYQGAARWAFYSRGVFAKMTLSNYGDISNDFYPYTETVDLDRGCYYRTGGVCLNADGFYNYDEDTGEILDQICGRTGVSISNGRFFIVKRGEDVYAVGYSWRGNTYNVYKLTAAGAVLESSPVGSTSVTGNAHTGMTSDFKRAVFLVTHGNTAPQGVIVYKVGDDFTLTPELDLSNEGCLFYPWLNRIVARSGNAVRFIDYDPQTETWTDKVLPLPVSLNYNTGYASLNQDASVLCVVDGNQYANNEPVQAYFFTLAADGEGYNALPAVKGNFTNAAVTGFATGNLNEAGDIEVMAMFNHITGG